MIQVDVFWSFAMGACFAALAPVSGIQQSRSMFINKYFVACVCYLSMIFAPSGIYLLWQHDRWETMFFLDKFTLHGIWPCLFAHTNVSLGCLGFMLCFQLIKRGTRKAQHYVWVTAYDCMFAILTIGYDRFLYAGSGADFDAGVKYSLLDFFTKSEVFRALIVMSIFVLPPLFYVMRNWPAEHGITRVDKTCIVRSSLCAHLCNTLLIGATYFTVTFFYPSLGVDRLLAYGVGQVVFGAVIFVPLLFIPCVSSPLQPYTTRVKTQ